MSVQRFRQVKPVQLRKIDQQIAAGVTASVVGQSPDVTVDINLSDDAALADLQGYMTSLGWEFVTTNPTSPRPMLASQYQAPVINKLDDPPGSPASGDRYIVGVGTGDWAGHDNEIAEWDGNAWQFTVPTQGMTTWDDTEKEADVFSGSWEPGTPRELAVFEARDALLTAATAPVLVTRNGREMIEYQGAGGARDAYYTGVVPRSYVRTGPLRVKVFWVAETADVGAARIGAAFERLQPDGPNVDSNTFAAVKASNTTTNVVNGRINNTTLSFTNAEADNIRPGNPFRLLVRRQPNAGGDNMAGAVQTMRIVVVQ